MKKIVLAVILLLLVCRSVVAQATTYYISPTGSNSNNGLSSGEPFLTFAYALDPTRASCGDTLNLANGVYGDGTNTGKLSLAGRTCTVGNELTIRALNSRRARINDNGTGNAIHLTSLTAYIIFDGIVANSTNNSGSTGDGRPFNANNTDHITIKNSLFRNPNKYANAAVVIFVNSRDALVEDTEIYDFHRHAITFFTSRRMIARRVYANVRIGGIPGGYEVGGQLKVSEGGTLVSMYPCQGCVLENGIIEGPGGLNEMNATFNLDVPMSGSKILGSIALGVGSSGHAVYLNGRGASGANYSPTNITLDNVVIAGKNTAHGIRNSDPVNVTLNHITILGASGLGNGIISDNNSSFGATAMSTTITNSIVKGATTGFQVVSGIHSWTGKGLYSNGNSTAFNPAGLSNWTNTSTSDPGLGTCIAWVPDGAAAKGAGANGKDIGANILYRYQNGVLTNVPLWDPTTGEFPHGALVAGVNDVAGKSLFDVHKRLNINTNGCSFPANYGDGVTDVDAPATPTNLSVF